MNKRILIIGNGFDLRHFLPTKYNHFICILREIENSNITSDFVFEDLFSNEFQKYDPFFYGKIKEFYNTNELIFQKENLSNIKTKLDKNLWYKHFKSIDDSHIETWIDFETEINRVLDSIVVLFDRLDQRIKDSNEPFDGLYFYDFRSSSTLDYFESSMSRILLTNLEIFTPLDGFRYRLNDEYLFKINDEIQLIHKNKILNNLYESLQEFTGLFNDYFLLIVSKFYSLFRNEKKEKFLQLSDNIYAKLLYKIDKIYSFNYTKTIKELYLEKEIEFLHGEIIDNWNNLNDLKIVLGVDDLNENLKKHKLFNFTKYFQKLHKQTDYQFLYNIEELDSYTFYFWGHSLDVSDKEYIREVFNQLNKDKSYIHQRYVESTNIIIFYHSISAKADQLNNLLSIIGKEEIEMLMKRKKLIFVHATEENLFNTLLN